MLALTFAPVEIDGASMSQMVASLVASWIVSGIGFVLLIIITVLVIRTYRMVSRLDRAAATSHPGASVRKKEPQAAQVR